jgi:hypothetical protein
VRRNKNPPYPGQGKVITKLYIQAKGEGITKPSYPGQARRNNQTPYPGQVRRNNQTPISRPSEKEDTVPQMAEMRAGENSGRKYQGVGANSGGGEGNMTMWAATGLDPLWQGREGKGNILK